MKVTRVFKLRLNVESPISFCTDINANILSKLEQNYVGKCYKNCYVTGVNKIISRSDCYSLCDSAQIDVECEVIAEVCNPGDIVLATIENTNTNSMIICKSAAPNMVINVMINAKNKSLSALKVGMTIPLVISIVQYTVFDSHISALADVFLTQQESPKYYIKSVNYDESALVPIKALINELNTTIANAKLDEKAVKTMIKLVQAWPAEVKPDGKLVQLEDVTKLKVGDVVTRDTRGDLYTPIAYTAAAIAPYVECTMEEALISLYTEYYKWVKFIYDMVTTYNTEEKLKSHMIYWTILASSKKKN